MSVRARRAGDAFEVELKLEKVIPPGGGGDHAIKNCRRCDTGC